MPDHLTFGDIEGKLDVLVVECTRCARKGRYNVARLIEGSLPLDDWVALVRARQPEPARFGGNWFRRLLARFRRRRG